MRDDPDLSRYAGRGEFTLGWIAWYGDE